MQAGRESAHAQQNASGGGLCVQLPMVPLPDSDSMPHFR